ncbi:unnamed protein product, partial [Mesorhabditis belari]|uniref:Aspartyl/asparaginy/proline hydroxylase domain-containing protein n=1 Tax=Mesorhabditis belari TaxID=2138241 RepID=A0AAF3EKP6_9BILA
MYCQICYNSSNGFAGGQHPMTVALAPQRVDYSVTKGGARTWAVLLVFMFLCSSLYTVFSAKEVAELGVDFDGDGDMDLDHEVDEVDEVAAQQRHALKDTTPTNDDHGGHDKRNEVKVPKDEIDTADDDEAEYVETTLEEKLFAGLRAKMQKLKNFVKKSTNNDDGDDDDEQPAQQRRGRRNKKRAEAEKGKDEEEEQPKQPEKTSRGLKKVAKRVVDEDDDEEEEQEKETPKKKVQQLRWNPRTRREEMIGDDDDDDDDEVDHKKTRKNGDDDDDEDNDDEDDDEGEGDEKPVEKMEEKKEKGKEKEKEPEPEPESEPEEEEKDEKEEVDDEPEREQISKFKRSRGVVEEPTRPRLKTAHITDDAPKRPCLRKNCPTDFGKEPRKGLLKSKTASGSGKRYQYFVEEENPEAEAEEEEESDDEQDDDDDDEQPPIAEVIAIKKYRSMGREAYKRHAITNRDDHKHREALDQADHLVEKHEYDEAIKLFNQVLKIYPDSPRAHFGKGRAYDIRAEMHAEDSDVDLALEEYEEVIENDDTPDALFRQAASRVVERSRYRGKMHQALNAQRSLIDRFPDEKKHQTDFGLTFLMMKRHDDARKVFRNVLDEDPNNALALAYYGYILKVADRDLEGGVHLMRKGLIRGGDQITDPKFYYHLGDGLMQLGRPVDAYKVYEQGSELGLFLSAHQRSMYNVEGLTGRPWWTLEQTSYTKSLRAVERQWVAIRHEALVALEKHSDYFERENKAITVDGDWRALWLLKNEEWEEENCEIVPQTCAILREFRESSNASRSAMKISVLSSGTRVLPHCGPTNCKLQAHLGLVVPSEARIRVGTERRGWRTGRFIVFDDSFEHELSFAGASSSAFRLVLVIDLWHPEVDWRHRTDLFDED